METLRIMQVYEIGPSVEGSCIDGLGVSLMQVSKKLVERGHEVTFLTGQTRPASKGVEDIDGVRVVRVDFLGFMRRTWSPVRLGFDRQLFSPAAFVLGGGGLAAHDVYNGHVYASGFSAYVLSRRGGGVFVNTIHGVHEPAWGAIETSWLRVGGYRFGERLLCPLLARLSSFQIHTARYSMERAGAWGAPREKLVTILNGVDPDVFSPEVSPALESDVPIVFSARRLVRKNGLDVLIKAMSEVLKSMEARLVIAGEGPERGNLQGLAEALHISKHVTFLGGVPHHRLPPLIASADVVVIPSYIEASSLFMLEAMAMGKPLIATDVGGIPEVVRESETGVLVGAGDAGALAEKMMNLLGDEGLCGRLGGNARRDVLRSHAWDAVAEKYLSVFRRALEAA